MKFGERWGLASVHADSMVLSLLYKYVKSNIEAEGGAGVRCGVNNTKNINNVPFRS